MFPIVLVFLVISVQIEAKNVECETIGWIENYYFIFQETCYLNGTIVISDDKVELGGFENVNIGAILFDNNKNIKFLPERLYKKIPSLELYSARNAAIEKISTVNFAGLSKLKFLNLDFNKIEIIPEDCFQGLTQLQEISLSIKSALYSMNCQNLMVFFHTDENKIKTVNALAFANLPDLGKIHLRHNDCVDEDFTIGSDLSEIQRKFSKYCWLARPPISCVTLSAAVGRKSSLDNRTLNVCEVQPDTYIDKPGFKLASSSTNSATEIMLIINQRHIDFLPVSIHEQLPNLRVYEITNTPIRKISKENFEKLQLLEKLTLDRNQIEVIKSDTFEGLVNLKRIEITNQPLDALNGETFTNLPQLKYLNLCDNNCINRYFSNSEVMIDFSDISENCGFDELGSVYIECESYKNDILGQSCDMMWKTVINGTNFVIADIKDVKVKSIDFRGNVKVEYLPYKVYMQFPNLIKIRADECSIKQISKQNFENLNRLEEIWLPYNQIQRIFGDTFDGLKSLRWVDLSDNEIESISARTFDQLPLLSYVDLRENGCIDDKLTSWKSNYTAALWNGIMKNFTRKIIQQCAFTETGEREFEKVFDISCGIGKSGSGFVVGGNETQRGQWPFMVALISTTKNQFFCGGSVITASHVLTAAHCIQNKYVSKPKNASEIALLLGRHNLQSQAELGSETRGVKEVKIHPHWNSSDSKYTGDIAILEMDRPVQFSELIQPVCLTFEPEILQKEAGYVIGWGKSGDSAARHENIPRQVFISSVADGVCFAKDHKLGSMFSQGMFCAGGDGYGPCHGDSGGGFLVRYESLWTLRGVVSSGATRDDFTCDTDRYTLFTNAVDFATWIKDSCKVNENLGASLFLEKADIGQKIFSIERSRRKPIIGKDVISNGKRVFLKKNQIGLFG